MSLYLGVSRASNRVRILFLIFKPFCNQLANFSALYSDLIFQPPFRRAMCIVVLLDFIFQQSTSQDYSGCGVPQFIGFCYRGSRIVARTLFTSSKYIICFLSPMLRRWRTLLIRATSESAWLSHSTLSFRGSLSKDSAKKVEAFAEELYVICLHIYKGNIKHRLFICWLIHLFIL